MDKKDGMFLITSADEKNWKFDRPVIFLGEWCKVYDRKEMWVRMDAITAEPYKPDYSDIDTALEDVHRYTTALLPELTLALNRFHQTDHSERYWNLLLGHWIFRYTCVLYNRYHTLKQVFELYRITGTVLTNSENCNLATRDSFHFIQVAGTDDEWNQILYTKMIRFWNIPGIEVFQIEAKKEILDRDPQTPFKYDVRRTLLDWIKVSILPAFARDSDAVITTSYLPMDKEWALQLLFFQCPQFWVSPSLTQHNPDPETRSNFRLDFDEHAGFGKFIRLCLPEIIPVCFLEGYAGMMDQVNKLAWPVNPKFIFTSNRFDFDEIFKAWSAAKVEQGCKYFVGQHGNNYGTLKGIQYTPEQVEVTNFFTWGWTNEIKKNVPAFNFKLAGTRKRKVSGGEGLLLIGHHPPLRLTVPDESHQFIVCLEEQFEFVSALPDNIRKELTVRLHPVSKAFKWDEVTRWKDVFPEIRFNKSDKNIFKLTSGSKLVVHTYDSTGILETLALNIPTICFWNGGTDHLIQSARPYYELLMDVGILNNSPQKAANTVTANWNNIEEWWNSPHLQNARKRFCDRYSRVEKKPVRKLRQLLTANL